MVAAASDAGCHRVRHGSRWRCARSPVPGPWAAAVRWRPRPCCPGRRGADLSRFLIVGGLWLVVAAALLDPGLVRAVAGVAGPPLHRPGTGAAARRDGPGRGRDRRRRRERAHAEPRHRRRCRGLRRARRGAPLGLRTRRAPHGRPAAPQRGVLPLAGELQRRLGGRPRRQPADRLDVPALERALGTGAAALAGRSLLDAVHPEDAGAVAAALAAPGGVRRTLLPERACCSCGSAMPTASGATSRPASPTCAATPTSVPSSCTAGT